MTMPSENPKENPINFPPDRRFRIWIRPSVMVLFLVLILLPVAVAWIHYLAVGRRCCMKTLRWGGLARISRDPPQDPHYRDAVEGPSHV